MADIIDLKFVTDTTGLDKAVTKSRSLEKRIIKLAKEVATGRITSDQYTKAVKKSASELQRLSGMGIRARKSVYDYSASVYQAATASNKAAASTDNYSGSLNQLSTSSIGATSSLGMLSRQAHQTKNKMNANGMAMQQLGYQTGDFIVQVQSGTNAWVAAGQQLTQLTGVLGMMNPAWIGIGAALGIVVPLVTAVGAAFSRSKSSADDLTTTLDELENAYSSIDSINDTLEVQLVGTWAAASEGADNYLKRLREVTQESARSAGEAYLTRDAGILDQFKADLAGGTDNSGTVSQLNETIKQLEDSYAIISKSTSVDADILKGMKDSIKTFKEEKEKFLYLFEEGTTTEESVLRILALSEEYEKSGSAAMLKRIDSIIAELQLQGQITAYRKKQADDQKAAQDAADDALEEHAELVKDLYSILDREDKKDANRKAKLNKGRWSAFMAQMAAAKKLADIEKSANKKKQDAIDKEKSSMESKIYLQNTINGNFGDEVLLSEVRKQIARDSYKQSRLALGISEDIVLTEMVRYDKLQELLEANKDLTKEMAKQLALKNAIVSKTRGNLEGLGIIEGSTESKKFYDDKRAAELRAEYEALGKGGKGKKPTTMEGPIKALERQIELSKALFGLEGDERRRKEVFMQLEFQNRDLLKQYQEDPATLQAIADRVAAQEKVVRVLEEQKELQKEVADTIANEMGNALMSMVDGTKSVKDAFRDMANDIIKELYRIYVVKQITGMISGGIDSFMGFNASASANGNVFSNGNLVPYADGGIVGSPTTFPMNDGRTGLMGEAGPEAIMPLKRGKNGKLGVQAEGGSGDVIIHQNFNFTANGDESVKKIIAQQAPAIANMTKKQILDDRRRGGQMKQAFG